MPANESEFQPVLFFAEAHTAGHGAWMSIAEGVEFKLTRQGHQLGKRDTEVTIMEGALDVPRVYFDPGTSITGPTTYRFYTKDPDTDDYHATPRHTCVVESDPRMYWNPAMDMMGRLANDPRDALIVFLSARLAQEVSHTKGKFPKRLKETIHCKRFPVKAHFEFTQADLPVVAIDYGGGTGSAGDLGWDSTEENIKLSIYVAAGFLEERDATTAAIRGMLKEIEWFLNEMNCINISFGEFQHYLEDRNDPPFYMGQLSVGFTAYTNNFTADLGWEILGEPVLLYPEEEDGGGVFLGDNADGALDPYAEYYEGALE